MILIRVNALTEWMLVLLSECTPQQGDFFFFSFFNVDNQLDVMIGFSKVDRSSIPLLVSTFENKTFWLMLSFTRYGFCYHGAQQWDYKLWF